jgi:hypothetical protein
MESPDMISRLVVAWILFCLSVASPSSTCEAQIQPFETFATASRTTRTDFRTLHESLERLAHDRNLRLEFLGSACEWEGGGFPDRMQGRFEIVPARGKLPFLGDPTPRPIEYIGRGALRRIRLDPDTGRLIAEDGGDLENLRLKKIDFLFGFVDRDDQNMFSIEIRKSYSSDEIKVTALNHRDSGRAPLREVLDSLESKMRLISKLREARKKGLGEEQPEKRLSEREVRDPKLTSPPKPN